MRLRAQADVLTADTQSGRAISLAPYSRRVLPQCSNEHRPKGAVSYSKGMASKWLPGKASELFLAIHSLGNEAENSDRRHEQDEVVELFEPLAHGRLVLIGTIRTALREYALSSASVRASTKRRRRLGKLDGYGTRQIGQIFTGDQGGIYHVATTDIGSSWGG